MPATEEMVNAKCQENETSEVPISEKEQREIRQIYARLREAAAKLVGPDGKTDVLPNNVYSFLCRLLADLKAGSSVTILQSNAQLTTMEASKMLGTSRQFLINLLERGEIPFHKVGTHRRIYARDILAYKAMRDAARRKALDDLVRAEQEEGIYDRSPNDSHARQRVQRSA
jgi:excisionase family DNA binding protein